MPIVCLGLTALSAQIAISRRSRSSEPTSIDPPPRTPFQRSIATMGLSGTIYEINGHFRQKPPIFLTVGLLNAPPPLEFPLELVPALSKKSRMMAL